jgi:GNAT superfamily N-acetyltransferase
MIRYTQDLTAVDWQEAAEIFRQAPLGTREPEKLARAFRNSDACVVVYDDQRLIGLARALCDGEYQAAVYDVVLLPEYQGRQIGKLMMERLCEQLPVPNIILYAVPGREGFYRKCGFNKMLTAMAVLSPGMAQPGRGYLQDDGSTQELEAYKTASGLAHRTDIVTFFDFYEVDEGRKL